jgi:hypothetical protein
MKLNNCTTVRECLHWLDIKVPGFWDFATKKPLSSVEVQSISTQLERHWIEFSQMFRHIQRMKKSDSWSSDDACYDALLNNAFTPVILNSDLVKFTNPHQRYE